MGYGKYYFENLFKMIILVKLLEYFTLENR